MNWNRVSQQEVRFDEWMDDLPADAPLAIVEVTTSCSS
jgi:hypothetical protein